MKTVFALTPGDLGPGQNPRLSTPGKEKIQGLKEKMIPLNISGLIVGTGRRFEHVAETLQHMGITGTAPIEHCPLLETADCRKHVATPEGNILLANGQEVQEEDYIHLTDIPGAREFLWGYLNSPLVHEGSLFIAGKAFVEVLLCGKAEIATLYEISVWGDGQMFVKPL